MTDISHSRRRFTTAVLLGAVVGPGVHAQVSESEQESATRTKREFMELAIKDIEAKNQAIRDEREKNKEKSEVALFLQLPTPVPFVDFDYYYIDRELRWAPPSGSSFPLVTVPKGFVCDLASVPRRAWSIFPATGRYAYAAIVHDYLYWVQTTSRDNADKIFEIAMQDAEVKWRTRTAFLFALKVAGEKAWLENQKAKANGEKRVLKLFPENKLLSWKEWKSRPDVFKD